MTYRRTGRSGVDLPAISLGLWQNFGGVDNFETGRAVLRRAFDRGVTHFDLANNYGPPPGSAEENFGRILRRRLPPLSRRTVHLDQGRLGHVAGPLRRLRLAQIPDREPRPEPEADGARLCRPLLSSPPRPEDADRGDRWARSMRSCARARRSMSASRATMPEDTRKAAAILKSLGTPCLIHQPQYSMLNRWIEDGLLDVLGELGIGCIPFSPLAQGLLTNKYLKGIPADSRAAGNWTPAEVADHARAAQEAEEAQRHRQAAAARASPSWRSPGSPRSARHLGPDRRPQRRATRQFPRRA